MEMEIDSDQNEQVEEVLEKLLINVETSLNEPSEKLLSSSYFTSPTIEKCLDTSIFSFVNTCDSCGIQDSLFWRCVSRTKTVCNNCFFSQIYLLCFRDTKFRKSPNEREDRDFHEPIRKKTRSSFKFLETQKPISPISSLSNSLKALNENELRKSGKASSASSTASSCSVKTKTEKFDKNIDDEFTYSNMLRKSARFTNKSKKSVNNGKVKSSNKKFKSSPKTDENQSEKASPITSPASMVFNPIDTTQFSPIFQKSRRTKFFKAENKLPYKSPSLTSTIFTSDFIFHRGFYMQVGDIVALYDDEDETKIPYYAQIRAFLTDQYAEKSAVLTWLIPIDSNYAEKICNPKDFDPDMFVLGPSEEYPRPLKCLEFVCRLIECTNKFERESYFSKTYQYKIDLQRHKFLLNDLANSNVKLITKQSIEGSKTEHQIQWC